MPKGQPRFAFHAIFLTLHKPSARWCALGRVFVGCRAVQSDRAVLDENQYIHVSIRRMSTEDEPSRHPEDSMVQEIVPTTGRLKL